MKTKEERQTGKQALFAETPVMEALLKLAFPTIVGQIILVVYNMADTFFIGMRGSDAMLSAVTVCMPAFMFLSAIANLFGVGGASVIARALGAKDMKRAHRASAFAFWGCLAVTLLYALGTLVFLHPFLNLLGGTAPDVHAYAARYMICTVTIGGAASAMSILLSHLIRSEGSSVIASVGISLGGALNILLDPLFMFRVLPPGNEVTGAAIATALSNLGALLFFAVVLLARGKNRTNLRFSFGKAWRTKGIPYEVVIAGIPACVMTLFENISYAVLDKQISLYGTGMQAGIGVAKKVNMLAHSIVRGITQGALPLIAFNYASGDKARMRKAIFYATELAVATATVCMALCLLYSNELIALFIRHASPSRIYGAQFLRILCVGAPFSACAYTFISVFQAVGRSSRSFALAILRKGILDIPLMFYLKTLFGAQGVVTATPVTDGVCCLVAVLMIFAYFHERQRAAEYDRLMAEKSPALLQTADYVADVPYTRGASYAKLVSRHTFGAGI